MGHAIHYFGGFSEILGKGNVLKGPKYWNNLGIQSSRYLLPIVDVQAAKPGNAWMTQLSVLCFPGEGRTVCWSFRLEAGSESIKVMVGALYGLQPPRRARRGLRSGHSGGDRWGTLLGQCWPRTRGIWSGQQRGRKITSAGSLARSSWLL